MKIVNKPWGYEKWIAQTDKYVLKEIFMKKGCKSSLQYHVRKEETNYIRDGVARLTIEKQTCDLCAHEFFHVAPSLVHRVEALTDLTMIEVSTPEVDDVVRIEDVYGRPDGRIDSEHG